MDLPRSSGSANYHFEVKERLVKRTREKFAIMLQKTVGCEFLATPRADESDFLARVCYEQLPKTKFDRRVGFFLVDAKTPGFSQFLMKPRKSTEALEAAYQEACDIYPAEKFIPAVVFLVNGKYFVYTAQGSIEDESFLLIRNARKLRFVYSIGAYLSTMGLVPAES